MQIKGGPTCKRGVSYLGLISSNTVNVNFHNKSWIAFSCQMIFSGSSTYQIIWSPITAQDLLWKLLFTTLLALSLMSLTLSCREDIKFRGYKGEMNCGVT